MSRLRIMGIGLIVLSAWLGLAACTSPPADQALGGQTNEDVEVNQIVMDLAQASSDQYAGAMLDDDPARENEDAKGSEKVAQAIAKFFGVSVDDVNQLHADGLGYGEIVRAYTLAKSTGKSAVEIIALKKGGKVWGEIEKSLSVTPGKLSATLGTIMRENKETRGKGAKALGTPPAKGKNK